MAPMPRSAALSSMNNHPSPPNNSCASVRVLHGLIKKLCGFFFFSLLRKPQDGHEPDPAFEAVNHHINIDINQLTNSFSGVNVDLGLGVQVVPNPNAAVGGNNAVALIQVIPNAAVGGNNAVALIQVAPNAAVGGNNAVARQVDPNAAVGNNSGAARRVAQQPAVEIDEEAVGGNNAGTRRVAPRAAVDIDEEEAVGGNNAGTRPNAAVDAAEAAGRGQDESSIEIDDMLVDALWDKCCRVFSMEPDRLGRGLGVAALATMHMTVFAVFTTPPAGPIFEVHIRAYYMSLGGTSILAVVEAATAVWVVNSDVTPPRRCCLFFARSLLLVGSVLLSILTTHTFVRIYKV